MYVTLLSHTPEPEKLIAASAKLCYSPAGATDLSERLTQEATEKFLRMLMDLGHESPIEHVSFTFAIEGVSRTLTHQLVRHRIASYSQQSQRYVKLDAFEYITPPAIEADPVAKDIFQRAMAEDQAHYDALCERLFESHYKTLCDEEVPVEKARSIAEKKAIEDARYVFPNACETKIVVTMNARSLMNFFHHRCCERAQWEICEMAAAMLTEVKKVAPTLFAKAGPKCLSGPCPEGVMTCGHINEVRKKYNGLSD